MWGFSQVHKRVCGAQVFLLISNSLLGPLPHSHEGLHYAAASALQGPFFLWRLLALGGLSDPSHLPSSSLGGPGRQAPRGYTLLSLFSFLWDRLAIWLLKRYLSCLCFTICEMDKMHMSLPYKDGVGFWKGCDMQR